MTGTFLIDARRMKDMVELWRIETQNVKENIVKAFCPTIYQFCQNTAFYISHKICF